MFRSKLLFGLILLASLLIFGCSDDDEDDPTGTQGGHPPAAMVGSWLLMSVTVNGAPGDLATVLEWLPATVSAKMHIQTNGAYVYEEVDAGGGQLWWESGFVFVDGNEMDINVLQDGDGPVDETSPVTFTLGSDEMTIQEVDQGTTIVISLEIIP